MIEAIRRANRPGPPENSVRLRVACALAVLASILAAGAEHEVARVTDLAGAALVVAGMVFSYRTRARPPTWIKVLAAVGAVSVLVWFFHQLTAHAVTDITAVENPLTVMFIAIQVVHSFHVPARRDLIFSIAASAALIAVAAAQAIDVKFGFYAGAWMALSLWALVELWRSISGGGRLSFVAMSTVVTGMLVVAAIVFLLLPAPVVSVRISFQSRAGSGGLLPVPGALAGDSGTASQLAKPGSPTGRTRVGGYLGFAGTLDTALRGKLGNTLIMRVRAERPSYWIGETFDTWDGQSWEAGKTTATHVLRENSPYIVPLSEGDLGTGKSDLQTFYLATNGPNLVFHADTARQLWFPANSVFFGDDGTLVSPIGLGKGAIYTVESSILTPSAGDLQHSPGEVSLTSSAAREYTQLPHAYPRASQLALAVTTGATNNYDKVQAIIRWLGSNTRYSTNIPPLPAGVDTVNDFLFGSRVGFCEQISTSLAVMLRSLGIPSREVVGYVPDRYNPITDLYEVRAKDAHAWVQVWFPGYGWQSFDPTAVVPLANPSPGGTALKDMGDALSGLPWIVLGIAGSGVGAVIGAIRWRRSRPKTWDDAFARQIETAGRRSGRPRRPSETLAEYAAVIDAEGVGTDWTDLASRVSAAVYGSSVYSEESKQQMLDQAHGYAKSTRRRLRPRTLTGT